MTEIDKNKPVMITGATAYVTGWIVKKRFDEITTAFAELNETLPSDRSYDVMQAVGELMASNPSQFS